MCGLSVCVWCVCGCNAGHFWGELCLAFLLVKAVPLISAVLWTPEQLALEPRAILHLPFCSTRPSFSCRFQGWNSGCQTWRQVSFPSEPSCCPPPPNVAVFKHGFTFLHCKHSSFHSWVFVFCVFLFVYWPLSLGRSKGRSQASEKLLWMEHVAAVQGHCWFPRAKHVSFWHCSEGLCKYIARNKQKTVPFQGYIEFAKLEDKIK